MNQKEFSTSLVIACLLGGMCSQSSSVATGGTDGPNFLTGYLYSPLDDAPVENALVVLCALPGKDAGTGAMDSAKQTVFGQLIPLDSARSDPQGHYSFVVNGKGAYQVYALSPDSSFVAMRNEMVIDGSDTVSIADTMTTPVALKGSVPADLGYPVRVILFGTPFSATADSSGSFAFALLPPGEYATVAVIDNPGLDRRGVLNSDTVSIDTHQSILDLGNLSILSVGDTARVVMFETFDSARTLLTNHGLWWSSLQNATAVPLLYDSVNTNGTPYCARLSYAITDIPANASIGVNLGTDFNPWELKGVRDFSRVDSMSFELQGSGGGLGIVLHSGLVDQWNDMCFRVESTPSAWTKFTIHFPLDVKNLFDNAPQKSWADLSRAIMFISFGADSLSSGMQGDFAIDDIVLYKH